MCHGDLGGSSNFHRAKKDITDRVGALCLARGNQRQLLRGCCSLVTSRGGWGCYNRWLAKLEIISVLNRIHADK